MKSVKYYATIAVNLSDMYKPGHRLRDRIKFEQEAGWYVVGSPRMIGDFIYQDILKYNDE
jgi:hypothetical protein